MTRRALAALPLLLLPACGGSASPPEPVGGEVLGAVPARPAAVAAADDVRALARAQLDLALDVYEALAATSDDDVVLGPTSLHTALLMVRAGAAGQTADEMDDVLGLVGLADPLAASSALADALRSRSGDGVALSLADRLWVDRGFVPRQAWVDSVSGAFDAGLARLDLAGDPEGSRRTVNGWVAEQTRDRIPELFGPDSLAADTRVVLTDAVALDADWQVPFDAGRTRDAPFQLLDGTVVQVPTMQGGDGVAVARGEDWTAVRLPYAGEQLAMTVLVPDDLRALEPRLDADLLDDVDAAMQPAGPALSLPRFTARTSAALVPVLAALGMPSAFDDRADLSGISEDEELAVGEVQHEAVLTIDETGTEAAAATGVGVRVTSAPLPVVVDRPFLFVVRDTDTGAVLFLGRVTDPR